MELIQHITDTLRNKATVLQRYYDYHEGNAPVVMANDRLKETFRDLNLNFFENWAEVVIAATADRITLAEVQGTNTRTQQVIDDVWKAIEFDILSDDATEIALITGEAYFIAWIDEEGEVECYLNDPRICHVEYDKERPNRKVMAYKWWNDDDETRHIKVYTRDTISEYRTDSNSIGLAVRRAELLEEYANPYGIIPVFHLRTNYRRTRSDLHNVIPLIDFINILLTNMSVTSEYSAAPMKYVISNAQGFGNLQSGPNQVWHIPSGDGIGETTSVGQFAAADLNNFLKPIEHAISSISGISRTPHHMFMSHGDYPSGKALETAERPLIAKCEDYLTRFTPTYERLMQFLLLLKGIPEDSITITWAPVKTQQPLDDAQEEKTLAEAKLLKKDLGVSDKQLLKEFGYTDEEIETMQEEQSVTAQDAGTALLTAMSRGQTTPQE
jgi:hypothetical protein